MQGTITKNKVLAGRERVRFLIGEHWAGLVTQAIFTQNRVPARRECKLLFNWKRSVFRDTTKEAEALLQQRLRLLDGACSSKLKIDE